METLTGMLDELRRAGNVQNRWLATWLTEEEYESFLSDWESQLHIRAEGYSTKGKHSIANKF